MDVPHSAEPVVLREVSLEGLRCFEKSDGYGSTFGWVLDLIARWAEQAREMKRPLNGDFAKEMTGLVLIDELDQHLHPQWQMRVVSDLRRAFPRMSFVATTHNALTLQGARKGEIQVLRRMEDGAVEARRVDLSPGLGTDDVLTGVWFGSTSTLDRQTIGLFEHGRNQSAAPLRTGGKSPSTAAR